MSFSKMDRKVRAGAGNGFPIDPSADTEATFASAIADALRRDFGTHPNLVKHIARLTGVNMRTVQNWLHARNGPTGAGLVVLMRHSAEVTMTVLAMSDHADLQQVFSNQRKLAALRTAITAVLEILGPE